MANQERVNVAFPTLLPEQITALKECGTERTLAKGEALWNAGDEEFCCFVVLEGEVEVLEATSGEIKHVATHTAGEFTGDIDLLVGRPAIVSGRAKEAAKIVEIPAEKLREIVRQQPALGDTILRAFLMRRNLLLEQGFIGYRVIGSRYSADTLRIREFLSLNQIPFTWLDLERDKDVHQLLQTFNVCEADTPVVILNDGQLLKNPSNVEIAEHAGTTSVLDQGLYDLVIIGSGPAGLAAGVYGASEGLKTLMLDMNAPGGQAATSSRIENYMGFPMGLSGADLASRALVQAEKFGAKLSVPGEAVGMDCGKGVHKVRLQDGQSVQSRCVIVATGAHYKKLDVPGYDQFEGSGIYYAATQVESQLCSDADVAIVGAGNSAGQAAVFLSQSVRKVWLLVRGEDPERTMSSYLVERIRGIRNIEVLTQTCVTAVEGDGGVSGIRVKSPDGERPLEVQALFVFIGATPHTAWIDGALMLDEKGFVLTGSALQGCPTWKKGREPLMLETSCPGVFAAGDVRAGSVKRVASAVGEGAMAVALVHQYLERI